MADAGAAVAQFAFALYRADGVRAASLLLQDQRGADVNLVLVAAYVGVVLRHALTELEAQAMQRRSHAWQTDVVTSLRVVRRRLRDGPLPAPSAATDRLRDSIKQLEIQAERIELDDLAQLVHGWEISPQDAQSPLASAVSSIRAVLTDGVGHLPGDDLAAVQAIAEAASLLESQADS